MGAAIFQPDTIYYKDDILKPSVDDGYYYKCIVTGKTGSVEPTWIKRTISGTAKFVAVSYNLWLEYTDSLTNSTWSVTSGATLSNQTLDAINTGVVLSAINPALEYVDLTNQVTKDTIINPTLSRTIRFKVNQQ